MKREVPESTFSFYSKWTRESNERIEKRDRTRIQTTKANCVYIYTYILKLFEATLKMLFKITKRYYTFFLGFYCLHVFVFRKFKIIYSFYLRFETLLSFTRWILFVLFAFDRNYKIFLHYRDILIRFIVFVHIINN